jgi:hypothetical protein
MCLKFLLEGNPDNQALISSLEARDPEASSELTADESAEAGIKFKPGETGKMRLSVRKPSWPKTGGGGGGGGSRLLTDGDRQRIREMALAQHGMSSGGGRVLDHEDEDYDDVEDLVRGLGQDDRSVDKGKGKEKAVEDEDDELEFM